MKIITDTILFVQQELAHAEGGHDWFHIQRVFNNAKTICASEQANTVVVELAALLHDIADSKFHQGDETIGPAKARKWLEEQSLDPMLIDHVVAIIENVSYKGGATEGGRGTRVVGTGKGTKAVGKRFSFVSNLNLSHPKHLTQILFTARYGCPLVDGSV